MAQLNINGTVRDVQAEPDTPLLWVIREQVGLTGTKYGCGVAQCGACSVHIDDTVVRSCSIRLGDLKPTDRIVTIEGLSATSSHPVQRAWATVDAGTPWASSDRSSASTSSSVTAAGSAPPSSDGGASTIVHSPSGFSTA